MNATNFLHDLLVLNIGYWEHHADWNLSHVYSPFSRIYLVDAGEAWVVIDGKEHHLTPGHLYLIPAFTHHQDICKGDFSLHYIHVFERTERRVSIFDHYRFPFEIPADGFDEELVRRLLRNNPRRALKQFQPESYDNHPTLMSAVTAYNSMPVSSRFDSQGILLQLFSRFLASAVPMDDKRQHRIYKVLHYITEHLNESISVDDLAHFTLLSKDHFIRFFKKEMGVTPVEYIITKRIERAQIVLIMENKPVKEIAYTLGFGNLSYFNRLFKRVTGITPGEYRKANLFM